MMALDTALHCTHTLLLIHIYASSSPFNQTRSLSDASLVPNATACITT